MLKALLDEVIPNNTTVTDFQIDQEFSNVGPKSILLNARKIQRDGAVNILVILDDIT